MVSMRFKGYEQLLKNGVLFIIVLRQLLFEIVLKAHSWLILIGVI